MTGTWQDILGPGGAIARRLGADYETRPQQAAMASAVQEAMGAGHHLMVEAGTGVGKSFAYLLPAIGMAVEKRKRVIVSTHTIGLQQQLIDKDIPLIRAVLGEEFTAVLAKGRSNYVCLRRLEQATDRQGMLFERGGQFASLEMIQNWAQTTTDGSRSDLPQEPDPTVWDSVCAEHGNCLGKKCRFYKPCHWQAARRRMHSADILIVNHALFFSDLALRMAGVNYLPRYDLVVLDEAHTLEDVAGEHFGLAASEAAMRYHLRRLYDTRRGRGLLNTMGAGANQAIDAVRDLEGELDDFSTACAQWQEEFAPGNGRIRETNIVENNLTPKLRALGTRLTAMLSALSDEEEISELTAMAGKTQLLGDTLEAVLGQTMPDAVYWMEVSRKTPRRVNLRAAPISVSDGLKTHLFEKISSVVMCSATLCCGPAETPFAHAMSRLGVEHCKTLALGSPFDYSSQATLFIESQLPDPNDAVRFVPAACERIIHYVNLTKGGALVLFTSYKMLKEAAEQLRSRLEEMGLPLFVQGEGPSPAALLGKFRKTPGAVLLGVSSFWQGIDVRGEALRNVIIVKLPFAAPDEPLVEARLEAITRSGGNAFMQYSLPQAVIRFKQGFGRLIRAHSDRGIVVVLDSRVTSKRYGRWFLDALPKCKRVVVGPSKEQESLMFGNLHGWLIAAVLAALIVGTAAWLGQASRMSAPAGIALDPANMGALALPFAPGDVWPIFTDDSDATEDYQKVIEAWDDANQTAAEEFMRQPSEESLPLMQALLDARHARKASIFSRDLGAVISYDNDHPDLDKLYSAGNLAYKIGLSLNLHHRADEARAHLEAAFALGRQLYRERIIFDEYQKGVALMSDAAEAMRQVEPKGSRLYDQLGDFQRGASDYQEQRVIPIWQVISSVDGQMIATSAGDVAAMAQRSQERMWRVEATLKLGRYRFDAGSLGDQIGAAAVLRRLVHDPDPAVAAAAAAGLALTVEQYRMIH